MGAQCMFAEWMSALAFSVVSDSFLSLDVAAIEVSLPEVKYGNTVIQSCSLLQQ